MAYRKGERRIIKEVRPYAPTHPVAESIRRGSQWFDAWVCQMTTSFPVLTKRTKISSDRLMQLSHGAYPTEEEIDLLAATWFVTPAGLRESIEDGFR